MRRLLAVFAIPAAAAAVAALIPVGSGALLGADATFDGVVNGAGHAATVTVLCPVGATVGLAKPGQTWGVVAGSHGRMGDFGGSITASFGNPLGSSTFTSLGESKEIPATNVLPCSGVGRATFRPNDFGADKKSTEVGVQFVGVAS